MTSASHRIGHGPGRLVNLWHAVGLRFWTTLFTRCNRTVVLGGEHRPARGEGGVFILANHISAIDPFLIGATAMPCWSTVWWRALAKAELFRIPLVGWLLTSWGALPVHRGQHRITDLARIVASLQTDVLVAFPEGRRATDGALLPGRPGIGKIIYDARPRKILPVAIAGTDRILPKGRLLPAWGRTAVIAYGPPVDVGRFYALPDSVDTSRRIVDEVMRAIARLQATLPASSLTD